jgi:iron(III) transport system permease protein
LPLLNISLYATPAIIIVAYLARFGALALKAPAAAIAQLPRDLEEAAAAAGAGYLRRIRTIVAPLAAPAAVAGGLIVFLTAFNELTVSALLWSAGTETMGVVLYNLEDGGYATLASAVGVVSIVVVTLAMLVIDRLGRRLPRGVVPWR